MVRPSKSEINKNWKSMQVAILAGGLATRLRPLTEKVPKSLISILGKTFLEYQLDLLKKSGITRIVMCVGYLGEQIEDYFGNGKRFGVHIEYSYEDGGLLGTAGALKKAKPLLDDEFFTLYGDSYVFVDFGAVMSYFRERNSLALMTVYKNFDKYEKSNTTVEGRLVKEYSKEEKTVGMVYIDYGVNLFKKEALDLVPSNQPYFLDGLFQSLIEQDELLAYEVTERYYQIGSPKGLKEFTMYLAGRER